MPGENPITCSIRRVTPYPVIGDIGDRTLDLNDYKLGRYRLLRSNDCVVGYSEKVPLKYLVVEGYEPMTSGLTVHIYM